jgi:hypothetical protein
MFYVAQRTGASSLRGEQLPDGIFQGGRQVSRKKFLLRQKT